MNATDYRREGATVNLAVRTNLLDAAAAKQTKERFAEIPLDAGVQQIVIDLRIVDFVDSSGVGALLALCRRAPQGTLVRLVGVKPEVRTVLELLRLHRVFVISG